MSREVKITERVLAGHQVCPTCPDMYPGKCCTCGDDIPLAVQRKEADPFSARVKDDERFHLQCQYCTQESHAEARSHACRG